MSVRLELIFRSGPNSHTFIQWTLVSVTSMMVPPDIKAAQSWLSISKFDRMGPESGSAFVISRFISLFRSNKMLWAANVEACPLFNYFFHYAKIIFSETSFSYCTSNDSHMLKLTSSKIFHFITLSSTHVACSCKWLVARLARSCAENFSRFLGRIFTQRSLS